MVTIKLQGTWVIIRGDRITKDFEIEGDSIFISFGDGTLIECHSIYGFEILHQGHAFISHQEDVFIGETFKWAVFGREVVFAEPIQ